MTVFRRYLRDLSQEQTRFDLYLRGEKQSYDDSLTCFIIISTCLHLPFSGLNQGVPGLPLKGWPLTVSSCFPVAVYWNLCCSSV